MELHIIWNFLIRPVACTTVVRGDANDSVKAINKDKMENKAERGGISSPSHNDNIKSILNNKGRAINHNNKNEKRDIL